MGSPTIDPQSRKSRRSGASGTFSITPRQARCFEQLPGWRDQFGMILLPTAPACDICARLARRRGVDGIKRTPVQRATEIEHEQRIGSYELKRIVRLRPDVHADHIEPSTAVARRR